jgi:hypothetical protein
MYGKYLIVLQDSGYGQRPKYLHELYELVGRHYKYIGNLQNSDKVLTVRHDGVSILYISGNGPNLHRIFALILPDRVKKNTATSKKCTLNIGPGYISWPFDRPRYIRQTYLLYNPYYEYTIKMIDWSIIDKIVRTYKNQNVKSIIVEINEHTKEISINKLLEHVGQKLQNDNIRYEAMCYTYYFIEKTCDLYLFISLTTQEYQTTYLRFVILKYNILKPISNSEIIFLSKAYKLRMRKGLFYETLYKMPKIKGNETLFSHSTVYLILSYLGDVLKMHLDDSEKSLRAHSKLYFRGLFLYDKELLIEDYDTYMEVKDIIYNRKAKLNELFIEYSSNGETYSTIDRYDNVLVYGLKIGGEWMEGGIDRFRLLIIISEMELVQAVRVIQK